MLPTDVAQVSIRENIATLAKMMGHWKGWGEGESGVRLHVKCKGVKDDWAPRFRQSENSRAVSTYPVVACSDRASVSSADAVCTW